MPHTTTPDGIGIAYQVRGEGTEPLVLLAGQANNHHWWDGVRDDFHADRSTITLDYRGTGQSEKPDAPYSTELFALDVIAVLDDLGPAAPKRRAAASPRPGPAPTRAKVVTVVLLNDVGGRSASGPPEEESGGSGGVALMARLVLAR